MSGAYVNPHVIPVAPPQSRRGDGGQRWRRPGHRRGLRRPGDRVALLARGREGLAAAADEVERAGGEALVVSVDMADAKAVEDAAQQVVDAFGRIDVWVDNAFAGVFAPFLDITPDEYRRVTEATYLGYVFGTRAASGREVAARAVVHAAAHGWRRGYWVGGSTMAADDGSAQMMGRGSTIWAED